MLAWNSDHPFIYPKPSARAPADRLIDCTAALIAVSADRPGGCKPVVYAEAVGLLSASIRQLSAHGGSSFRGGWANLHSALARPIHRIDGGVAV
jgi:hypothetical protein